MALTELTERVARLEGRVDEITNHLIERIETSVDVKFADMRRELGEQIGGLRREFDTQIGGLRQEVGAQITATRELVYKVNRQTIFFVLGTWIATMCTILFHR